MKSAFTIRIARTCLLAAMMLFVAACGRSGGDSDTDVAVAVALTQTAAASQPEAAQPAPADTPVPDSPAATDESAATDVASSATDADEVAILTSPVYFISGDGQIVRLEADGQTQATITNESQPVTDFDVSPVDGRLVYVSANNLVESGPRGENPVIRVAGEPLSDDVLD
ncbi:MAG: hypothetical protein HC802_17560 [Caldilineaceae bacterium]|nr:hypothetical protein [Caldilineaceae bacterium]